METNDLIRRAEDLAARCERTSSVTATAFLTPAERMELQNAPSLRSAAVVYSGGGTECERTCAFFLPFYLTAEELDPSEYISAVHFRSFFGEPGHRDYLGALLALVLSLSLVGCAVREGSADDGRLRVVTTLFPYYDFARAVAGDRADVTLLLAPGREAHSFEPTPLDAVTISRADVFIYNGGEGEVWADDMLDAVGEDIGTVLRMMDFVDAREEEFSEGMQGADSHDHAHDHDHDHDHEHDHELHDHAEHDHDDSDEVEYDEHIWTSPKNAIRLCRAVADALCAADAENADLYRANCEDYCAQLEALDADLRALRANAVRDLLIFADRFPFLYFCEEYDLHYRAAFHGCSGDTEPSLATLKYLIDKVNDEHIPVVYTIDLSSQKVAEAVSECTGARIGRLWSMQTVSRTDFDAGETYLTLMQRNYEALKGGLL